MNRPTKDLFDDSTMTFGEHLEVLRMHLIKALLGLLVAVIICLYNGSMIVDFVRRPIDKALQRYSQYEITDDLSSRTDWRRKMYNEWGFDVMFGEWKQEGREEADSAAKTGADEGGELKPPSGTMVVKVPVDDLADALTAVDPDRFPTRAVPKSTDADGSSRPKRKMVSLELSSPQIAEFQATVEQSRRAVTLKVEEAFTTYIKVALIAALILSSPWIYYQMWLFVAEGLYPHERRYVHVYGTISLALFLFGAVFCFYGVFPFVLKFLLGFNASLKIHPQIRLSEWISFAVMLPLMFGISFQLPLVMLFLERISIFTAASYKEKRRLAVLVIAFLSMVLTPADPMSMIMMLVPLVGLYELGILLCRWAPATSPFDAEAAKA